MTEGFNHLKNCRHGRMLYNINDMYIGKSLDVYGEFSEGEVELFRQILRPEDVVVEVGGNIGAHTVPLAQLTSGGGGVIVFEPQRFCFQVLCGNIALNSISNVRAFQYAIGESQETIAVPILDPETPQNFGCLALNNPDANGEAVAMIRLDDLDLPVCRFLKIDVEGMELSVLKGGAELIRRNKPILYVENDRDEKSDELIRYIASLGYRMYWHRPMLFNPNNFFGHKENVFGEVASHNMLCTATEGTIKGLEPVEAPKVMIRIWAPDAP